MIPIYMLCRQRLTSKASALGFELPIGDVKKAIKLWTHAHTCLLTCWGSGYLKIMVIHFLIAQVLH